jgi:cell fate regulator YaaT (PSP1 superfamily)
MFTLFGRNAIMPRLTLEFPDQVNDILKELAEKDQTTKVDVFRRALSLYNYVHKEAIEKNLKLSIVDDERKVITELVFPF